MANRSYAFAVTLSESAGRKPSGIPSAMALAGREASVSSSFLSRLTLDGSLTQSIRRLIAMAVPEYQKFFLPVLRIAGDKKGIVTS
ncbi:MAG: hypothetical protein HXY51_06610 [Nitrospirae bacterium]|nr:hypothetical protein [Nitrospirota bacterium]